MKPNETPSIPSQETSANPPEPVPAPKAQAKMPAAPSFPIPAPGKSAGLGPKFLRPQPPRGFDRGNTRSAAREHARGRHAG